MLMNILTYCNGLYFDMFDQRIDFTLQGEILTKLYVPLTYEVKGKNSVFMGVVPLFVEFVGWIYI